MRMFRTVLISVFFVFTLCVRYAGSLAPRCFASSGSSPSPDVAGVIKVRAYVDKDHIYIGDRLHYALKVTVGRNYEIELPHLKDKLGGFLIIDSKFTYHRFFKKTVVARYILTSYKPGSYKIPSLEVKYRRKGGTKWMPLRTQEVSVQVKGLVGNNLEAETIKDIKGPISPAMRWWIFTLIIAVGFLIAALLWFLRKRKKDEAVSVPFIPPHTRALAALEDLKRRNLPAEGKVKEFYSILSGIVRTYIEERFHISAPRMSTEEFLDYAKTSGALSSQERLLLADFLHQSDMVKFARYRPDVGEIVKSMELAKRFIEETKEEKDDGVS